LETDGGNTPDAANEMQEENHPNQIIEQTGESRVKLQLSCNEFEDFWGADHSQDFHYDDNSVNSHRFKQVHKLKVLAALISVDPLQVVDVYDCWNRYAWDQIKKKVALNVLFCDAFECDDWSTIRGFLNNKEGDDVIDEKHGVGNDVNSQPVKVHLLVLSQKSDPKRHHRRRPHHKYEHEDVPHQLTRRLLANQVPGHD